MHDAINDAAKKLVTEAKYDEYLETATKRCRDYSDFRETTIRSNVSLKFINEVKAELNLEALTDTAEYNRMTSMIVHAVLDIMDTF